MVENETTDEAGLGGHLVLHVHDFDHVEIDALVTGDSLDGINDDLSKRVSDGWVNLGVEGGACNVQEQVTAHFILRNLESFKETESLSLGLFETINEDSWMDTFTKVSLSLAHEFTNEENVGGGTITDNIILSGGSAANHGGGWVLNLHLVEKNATIFGELDLTSTTDEPIIIKAAK